MISVNCAAIPEPKIDVELSGCVNDEVTSATKDYYGLIKSADQSSLFLDEIGELSTIAQSRLLQFLEDSAIRRIGGIEQIHVNVRLTAATHRNLLEIISIGEFRADSYYRLNVFKLTCPPLRDCGTDSVILGGAFLEQVKNNEMHPEIRPSCVANAAISKYRWPCSVRELYNVIQ